MSDLNTYHEFDDDGKHYRLVYDEDYQTDRQCAPLMRGGREPICTCPDDEKANCEKFYREEIEKLESGEWVALGCIVSERCGGFDSPPVGLKDGDADHCRRHCRSCTGWDEVESLWGIVVENNESKAEEWAKVEMGSGDGRSA
jgi:hypothetical protein